MGNEEIHFQLFNWTQGETLDCFGWQNISTSVFRQVTIIPHVRMSSHFLQSWGAVPAKRAGGAEGTPRAWGNFTCAMGCWGAHWDLQVPDEGSFHVPTLSFPAAQGDIIRLTPSFNFQFAAEKPQNFRAVSSPLCFYSDSFYSLENSRTVCAKQRKTTSSTLQSLKIKCQTGQEKLMW